MNCSVELVAPGLQAPEDPACAMDTGRGGRRWILSDDVVIEHRTDARITLLQRASSARLMVTPAVHRFLLSFERAMRLDEAWPSGIPERLRPQWALLVSKGFLVDADADADAATDVAQRRNRLAVAHRFCNAPAFGEGRADVVALGIPYDLASDVDSREAPGLLRRRSHDHPYEVSMRDGVPRGWFDANRGARILAGAHIADAGDVPVVYGESQAEHFRRIASALDEVCVAGRLPLLLGGDRTTTCAAASFLATRDPLTVILLSPQACVASHDPAQGVIEGGIASWLLSDPGIRAVVALGDVHPGGLQALPRMQRVGAAALLADPHVWSASIGTDEAVYLSIDLAIATPYCMPAGDARAGGGLSLDALRNLLLEIGAMQRIVGIDLVGLDTRRTHAEITAAIGCNLALTALDAALQARAGRIEDAAGAA